MSAIRRPHIELYPRSIVTRYVFSTTTERSANPPTVAKVLESVSSAMQLPAV